MLTEIAHTLAGTSLDLHVSVYVTCLCQPENVPPVPNMDVLVAERPAVVRLLRELVTPPRSRPNALSHANASAGGDAKAAKAEEAEDVEVASLSSEEGGAPLCASDKLNWVGLGGGVAVCAAGPETMTREARNAVARVGLTRGVELGGVALHTELFAM